MKVRRLVSLLLVVGFLIGSASCGWGRSLPRPLGKVTKEQIIEKYLSNRNLDPVEGLWLTKNQETEVAIFKYRITDDERYKDYDYVGIVVWSRMARVGEVIYALRRCASEDTFPGRWEFDPAVFILKDENTIEYGYKYSHYLFRIPLGPSLGTWYGSGFLIDKTHVVTNYHVVADHKKVEAALADGRKLVASLTLYDAANDLAVLTLSQEVTGPALPLGRASSVKGGARVYTIGFPLPTELGTSAKVGEGIVNSLTGIGNDPRMYQISVPIQPGNSGGPLLDNQGRVVGIVTLTLDNVYAFQRTGAIPQNVNFAMKVSYLENLLEALPVGLQLTSAPEAEKALDSAGVMEKAAPSVVLITAKD